MKSVRCKEIAKETTREATKASPISWITHGTNLRDAFIILQEYKQHFKSYYVFFFIQINKKKVLMEGKSEKCHTI
jgi:hypothetical protein